MTEHKDEVMTLRDGGEGYWNNEHDVYTAPIDIGEWGARIECYGVNPDDANALRARVLDAIAARDATAPEGTWLWGKFMDLCKSRGVAPTTQNDLFAIAEEAHKLNIAARDAKVEVTGALRMFAKRVINLAYEGDLDGDFVLEMAVSEGLLKLVPAGHGITENGTPAMRYEPTAALESALAKENPE